MTRLSGCWGSRLSMVILYMESSGAFSAQHIGGEDQLLVLLAAHPRANSNPGARLKQCMEMSRNIEPLRRACIALCNPRLPTAAIQ